MEWRPVRLSGRTVATAVFLRFAPILRGAEVLQTGHAGWAAAPPNRLLRPRRVPPNLKRSSARPPSYPWPIQTIISPGVRLHQKA